MKDQQGYIVLCTATKKEMYGLLRDRDCPELNWGQIHPWDWRGKSFLLLVTGLGPINAAMNLGKLMGESITIQGVINIGIAGSFDLGSLALLDLVVVQEEIWPEYGLYTEKGIEAKKLSYPLGKIGSKSVWDRVVLEIEGAKEAMAINLPDQWPWVRSLSLAGVSGTPERVRELISKYNAQLENMEGFALAWTCIQEKIPFLELRAISNLVGTRDKSYWDIKGAIKSLANIFDQLWSG